MVPTPGVLVHIGWRATFSEAVVEFAFCWEISFALVLIIIDVDEAGDQGWFALGGGADPVLKTRDTSIVSKSSGKHSDCGAKHAPRLMSESGSYLRLIAKEPQPLSAAAVLQCFVSVDRARSVVGVEAIGVEFALEVAITLARC